MQKIFEDSRIGILEKLVWVNVKKNKQVTKTSLMLLFSAYSAEQNIANEKMLVEALDNLTLKQCIFYKHSTGKYYAVKQKSIEKESLTVEMKSKNTIDAINILLEQIVRKQGTGLSKILEVRAISSEVKVTRKWKEINRSVGRRLIRDYGHELITEAVEYFTTDTFWADKIVTFMDVSHKMERFLMQRKRGVTPGTVEMHGQKFKRVIRA